MFCALCGKVYNDPFITSCGVSVGSQNCAVVLIRVMFTEYCDCIFEYSYLWWYSNTKLHVVYMYILDISYYKFQYVKEEIIYTCTYGCTLQPHRVTHCNMPRYMQGLTHPP